MKCNFLFPVLLLFSIIFLNNMRNLFFFSSPKHKANTALSHRRTHKFRLGAVQLIKKIQNPGFTIYDVLFFNLWTD